MSDQPTLLRVQMPNTEGAMFAEAGVQAWINSGVLVPVEPVAVMEVIDGEGYLTRVPDGRYAVVKIGEDDDE